MLMQCLVILLLNLVIYLQCLKFKAINDDLTLMKVTPYNLKRARVTSILLHTVVAEYIFIAFGANTVSFIAALMFSIHPLTVQVSAWWSGREYGIAALKVLMAIAFAPIGGIFYFIGKSGIIFTFTPLIFLFTKNWYMALITPILALTSYKFVRHAIKVRADRQKEFTQPNDYKTGKWRLKNLIVVAKTFWFYVLNSILPMKCGFYNSYLVGIGSSEADNKYWFSLNRHFWLGILSMIVLGVLWAFNIYNLIGMGILLFVLAIGPYLNFVTVQMWTSPRYAYLALIGFQIALVSLCMSFGIPGYCILSALWLFYLDRTIRVLPIYKKDNISMMVLDRQVFPDNARLWYYCYEHMLHKNNPIMAFAEAAYGLKHLPKDCQLWFGLACASFMLGDYKASSGFLDNAEKYMIMTERENMRGLIKEFRQRIETVTTNKNVKA
jgi:hypothetical protein